VFRRLLLCLAGALTLGAAPSITQPAWVQPTRLFHVVGPIYYVGTAGIAVYLIRTRAGLILLDGGLEESVQAVEGNIAALGFRVSDIKLMLETHAHFDHVEALATLKRDSGAQLAASPGDRGALESGIPPSEVAYGVYRFPPVKVDRVLADGRPVTLGGVSLTPVFTPGHTPGCTTWTMRVSEGRRPLNVVFPCSITVAGNKLVGNKGYPGIVADFRRTFARMRSLRADVVLPAHPEIADVLGRARRRDAGDGSAFVAPGVLPRLIDQSEAAFTAELRKQEGP
jgi:metallo-beta-lactamase class B